MSLDLSALARELIGGAHGAGAAFAMRFLARFAEAVGARSFSFIAGAHVDGVIYHGRASLDFAERMVSLGVAHTRDFLPEEIGRDAQIGETAKAVEAAMLSVAFAIQVSGGAEHQGPAGGGPVAVIARERNGAQRRSSE